MSEKIATNRSKRSALRKSSRDKVTRYLEDILALLEALAKARKAERMLIRIDGRFILVSTAEIDWVEAEGNYVRVHSGSKQYVIRERIGQLERRLDSNMFVRVNRSAIVNIERVRELQPLSHGDLRLVLKPGTELTLSRNYRKNLNRVLIET